MFVSSGLPWEVAPPMLTPLGGILGMLEGKDTLRSPLLIPPPVPRTAACVVLPHPNPLIPLSHPSSPVSVPSVSPRNTGGSQPPTGTISSSFTKASPPQTRTPPLKFGVDRLLSADPKRDGPPPAIPLNTSRSSNTLFSPLGTSSGTCSAMSSLTTGGVFGTTTCPVLTTTTTTHGSVPCPSLPMSTGIAMGCPGLACGCDAAGGKCPTECGYFYSPMYPAHPGHLLPYASLYGGNMAGGASHRHEVMGVPTGAHGRRKRTWTRAVFSNLQRKGLEKRFTIQKYITKPDRRQLAATLGLTDAQVKVWFQNRRMKWRHAELKKREQQKQDQQIPAEQETQQHQLQQSTSASVNTAIGSVSEAHFNCLSDDDDDDEDDADEEDEEIIDPVEDYDGEGDSYMTGELSVT